jgi:hypothetical protein
VFVYERVERMSQGGSEVPEGGWMFVYERVERMSQGGSEVPEGGLGVCV